LQWTCFHKEKRGTTPASGWLRRLVRRLRSCGGRRGLNETQDVSIWIADVELCPVRHVPQWDNECNARRSKTLRERLCTLNADVDVAVLLALKCGLVAWWRWRALQMNVAAAAANSGVEALVSKLDSEAKAIAIEGK
jgi:hypothetical protein